MRLVPALALAGVGLATGCHKEVTALDVEIRALEPLRAVRLNAIAGARTVSGMLPVDPKTQQLTAPAQARILVADDLAGVSLVIEVDAQLVDGTARSVAVRAVARLHQVLPVVVDLDAPGDGGEVADAAQPDLEPYDLLSEPDLIPLDLTPPSDMTTVYAFDDFQRGDQSHWGKATDQQDWAGLAATNAAFSISSQRGRVSVAGASAILTGTLGPSLSDSNVLAYVSSDAATSYSFGVTSRWSDSNDLYALKIDPTAVSITRVVGGASSVLTSAPFSPQSDTTYAIRFVAQGSNLMGRVWPAGSVEPSTWTVGTTDGSLASGYSGIRAESAGGSSVYYTRFVVTP